MAYDGTTDCPDQSCLTPLVFDDFLCADGTLNEAWLNRLNDRLALLADSICCVAGSTIASSTTAANQDFIGVVSTNIYSNLYVRQFASSTVIIDVNIDNMIEVSVDPANLEQDLAIRSDLFIDTGAGFTQFGENFLNSVASALPLGDDSGTSQTHLGTVRVLSGSGDINVAIRFDSALFQGLNLRGNNRNIVVSYLEIKQ